MVIRKEKERGDVVLFLILFFVCVFISAFSGIGIFVLLWFSSRDLVLSWLVSYLFVAVVIIFLFVFVLMPVLIRVGDPLVRKCINKKRGGK